ncbi:MAG TPA: hypothetical protein VLG71_03305 [Candidatus Limnocylindria bacterium]|nr:hypothetical protein [Candidatus Limnocylindria bacterium]
MIKKLLCVCILLSGVSLVATKGQDLDVQLDQSAAQILMDRNPGMTRANALAQARAIREERERILKEQEGKKHAGAAVHGGHARRHGQEKRG